MTRPAIRPLFAVALLIGWVMAARARGQENPTPRRQTAWESARQADTVHLDKLHQVRDVTFKKLAHRLITRTNARSQGGSYSAHFQHCQHQGTGGIAKSGQAEVFANGRMWTCGIGDFYDTVKELYVSNRPEAPRSITFLLRVRASDCYLDGKKQAFIVTKVLGQEEIAFQLIEDPKDKVLRLVIDPLTFLKHQDLLSSNSVKEGKEDPAPAREKDAAAKSDAPDPKAADRAKAKSEITLVRFFQADEYAITIGFRRKWSGLEGKHVDGVLKVRIDSSLSASLHYEVPDKSGKMIMLLAGFFNGGWFQ